MHSVVQLTNYFFSTFLVRYMYIGGREVRRRRVKRSVKLSLLINVQVTCSITLNRKMNINKYGYKDPSRSYTKNTTLTINNL